MVKFFARISSNKPCNELFANIDTIHKLMANEKEFLRYRIISGSEKQGIAFVEFEIFGRRFSGKMKYDIKPFTVNAAVFVEGIRHLRFGYVLKPNRHSTTLLQFVEFDVGLLGNLYALFFLRSRIVAHMKEELCALAGV